MATVTTVDKTDKSGYGNLPLNENDFLNLVETIASQNIRAVESTNQIEDAFYEYPVENGKVIQEAIIKMAEAQAWAPTAEGSQPDLSPLDPSTFVKYFNNWEGKQFKTTIRKDDIRAIIAKGTSAEQVAASIMATLTNGESNYDYGQERAIIESADVGVSASTVLFDGKVPASMKGVLYAIREMFNAVKATNTKGLGDNIPAQGVAVGDIRIAIPENVLALIDFVELASLFNMSKEEILGKVVSLPYDENYEATKYICVYDRKALGRGTRVFDYSQDVLGLARYTNHGLTTERAYFYNGLFKFLRLDVTAAVTAAKANLFQDAE